MSDDFQVGDVVVKIAGAYRLGHIARVTGTEHYPGGSTVPACTKLYLRGWVNNPGYDGFASYNFRKLPRADEQFTATIRACRPTRVGEPA